MAYIVMNTTLYSWIAQAYVNVCTHVCTHVRTHVETRIFAHGYAQVDAHQNRENRHTCLYTFSCTRPSTCLHMSRDMSSHMPVRGLPSNRGLLDGLYIYGLHSYGRGLLDGRYSYGLYSHGRGLLDGLYSYGLHSYGRRLLDGLHSYGLHSYGQGLPDGLYSYGLCGVWPSLILASLVMAHVGTAYIVMAARRQHWTGPSRGDGARRWRRHHRRRAPFAAARYPHIAARTPVHTSYKRVHAHV